MDKFWVDKAHRYIEEHNAFEEVSGISIVNNFALISAKGKVNLPGRFIRAGITDTGVKAREEVRFIFPPSFPLKAPIIKLRDDFPKCFPHINPSQKLVIPCIYEGELSELLQQSAWMDGILNQLADWLEKAASNDLMNYEQGWEPMRNDHYAGFIEYDTDSVVTAYNAYDSQLLIREIRYEARGQRILAGLICNPKNLLKGHLLYFLTPYAIRSYVPNTIRNLSQLYEYAGSIGLNEVKKYAEKADLDNITEDKLFIVLSVKRPVNLIGSDSNIEFLNFVISKAKRRNKKGRELKRTLPECEVRMLYHISESSPRLLRRLSGMQTKIDANRNISLVGCGSLGSKIGIHLARNGNGPFQCVDKDIFMPHNNARHALTLTWAQNKAELLSLSIHSISKTTAEAVKDDALNADFSKSRVIIDTTASLSVRNFLMGRADLPPIISCGLYSKGRSALMLLENENKAGGLVISWADLYHRALTDADIQKMLFVQSQENVPIGQSCSSSTMVVDDARISLMAATMSLKIQHVLEAGLPESAEILIARYDDSYCLNTRVYSVPEYVPINPLRPKEWKVFILRPLINRMRDLMHNKAPKETGGALLGSVFLYPKMIVITDIIDAPPDSVETPTSFILGVEGLEHKIKNTEAVTSGKVTYLGTWHSHPQGGTASSTDERTFIKLLFVRNYEPTVCLIITEDEVMMV